MIKYLLIVYLTTGPLVVGDTANESACIAWEQYSVWNKCVRLIDL